MQLWDQMIGHEWAVQLLRDALRYDRVGHAYLFTGPAHIGKTTLANLFAQAINCLAPAVEDRPCGQCRACQLTAAGRHPDVKLLSGTATGRGRDIIKIDQIRELQSSLNLAAYEGRYQIAILDRFDTANASAANAFLKTLEEPPPNVILMLTALDAELLLPTISSRCRTVAMRPLPAKTIQHALETRWQVAPETAARLAHLADGRLGWAITAIADETQVDEREAYLSALHALLAESRVARFKRAQKMANHPEQLVPVLETWQSWWRDLALLVWGGRRHKQITNIDDQKMLRQLSQLLEKEQILTGLKQTGMAIWQLQHNANTRLVLENLFLVYPLAFVE